MKEIQIEKSTILQEMKKIKIFSYLTDKEREDILGICKILHFEESEKVITEGEVSPYIYAVIEGMISIMVQQESGKEVFISPVGEGDVFGEAAIFMKKKRTASAVSNNAVLLQIERESLIGFIKQHPGAGIKILMLIIYSLLNKLRESNQELALERKANIQQSDVDDMIDIYFLNSDE